MTARQWIDVATAAKLLGVSARTVLRYVRAGALPATRVGRGPWRLDRAQFHAFAGELLHTCPTCGSSLR